MREVDQNNDWAWEQIEAMADDSLVGADRRRMRQAMGHDPRLHDAVERARTLRKELQQLSQAPAPAGLRRRLLDIPSGRSLAKLWFMAPVIPAIAAIAAYVVIMRAPLPSNDPGVVALLEFRLAMSYVQKSAAVTSEEISNAVRDGLREAYTISRSSVLGESLELEQGDRDDD